MKKVLFALLPMVIVLLGACTDSTSEPDPDAEFMAAKIDGNNWTAEQVDVRDISSAIEISGTSIIGTGGIIAFGGVFDGPGTYSLGQLTSYTATYTEVPNLGSATIFVASDGSITFSKLDSEGATGTFTFEAVEQGNDAGSNPETRSVTAGEFNVRY